MRLALEFLVFLVRVADSGVGVAYWDFVLLCKITAPDFPLLSPLCRPEGPEEGARAPLDSKP